MTKLRVYEYAKKLNMSSKEIITILNRLDVPVANHMSVMDDGMVQKVEQFFSDVKQRAAQKHATEVERDLREKQRQRERAARQSAEQGSNVDNRPHTGRSMELGSASRDGRNDNRMGSPSPRPNAPSRDNRFDKTTPDAERSRRNEMGGRSQGNLQSTTPARPDVRVERGPAASAAMAGATPPKINQRDELQKDGIQAENVESKANHSIITEQPTQRSALSSRPTTGSEATASATDAGHSSAGNDGAQSGESVAKREPAPLSDRPAAAPRYGTTGSTNGGRPERSDMNSRRDRTPYTGNTDNRDHRSGAGYSGNRDNRDRRPGGNYSGYHDHRSPAGSYGASPRDGAGAQSAQGDTSSVNRDSNRPTGSGSTGREGGRSYGGSSYNQGGNRTSGGYSSNRDGNRTGSYGGHRDSARPAGSGSTGRDGNRSYGAPSSNQGGNRTSGGYSSSRDGNRTGSYGGGRTGGRPGGSGYGGNRSGGGSSYGGNRPGGGSGYGGNRSGGASAGGNRFGGGRTGGRPGAGRPNSSMLATQTKAGGPMARKDKEKDKGREAFDRDRREQFNEDKLVHRSGGRRRTNVNHTASREVRRPEPPAKVTVEGSMAVGDFAKLLKREPSEIIKKLLFLSIVATINQEIDTDVMELIAGEFGTELVVVAPVDEEALDMLIVEEDAEALRPRPPVVTIMGHVDHGKTTLLDAIRESKVTATESGGITQHIGAYQVETHDRRITFLDTPGHEAFTTMRARGAQVTDITILVVAADDGVMPQTIEAINHAKAANVPIIVAVNKIDKPGANPDRVKQELTTQGLVAEEWGGDTIFVNISALKHQGLDDLLDMVLLVADMADLKANPVGRPRGTVIEAKLDKGRGPVATVLIQNGTLKVGDIVVAGTSYGHVRAMVNDRGKRMKEAGPSMPVEIQGLGEVPSAGDLFVVYDDERKARNLVEKRTNKERAEQMQTTARVTLEDLYRQIKEGNIKELNVIVKADVQGSVEALVQSIEKLEVEGVRVKVIHRGAGAITESDVALASASNAVIIGFHVRPDVNAGRAAEAANVDIRLYRVIYNAIAELESAMKGMLDPEFKEVVLGHAEVRQVFHISKIGTVCGGYVTDGKLARDAEARLIRNGVVVYEGALDSLKRFKDDAKEVATGFECGVVLANYNDVKIGDVVEAFKMEAIKVQ